MVLLKLKNKKGMDTGKNLNNADLQVCHLQIVVGIWIEELFFPIAVEKLESAGCFTTSVLVFLSLCPSFPA